MRIFCFFFSARIIRIENTGSEPANNLEISTSGFPTGTSITNNDCMGTLNADDTCDITITPGSTASSHNSDNTCTTSPGTEPVPTIVTFSADNAPSTNINVLVLGYGCIYQGGFLFSVDDSTSNTGNISGKVAALTDEEKSNDGTQGGDFKLSDRRDRCIRAFNPFLLRQRGCLMFFKR